MHDQILTFYRLLLNIYYCLYKKVYLWLFNRIYSDGSVIATVETCREGDTIGCRVCEV